MPTSESIVDIPSSFAADPANDDDDVDSLPSTSTTPSTDLDSEADTDAQAEWERGIEQLQLLMSMVLVPFLGKYFGRKFAYWSEQSPLCCQLAPLPSTPLRASVAPIRLARLLRTGKQAC